MTTRIIRIQTAPAGCREYRAAALGVRVNFLSIWGLAALHLVICWWNCRAVGPIWSDAKTAGGTFRLLAWCGAAQATIGISGLVFAALIAALMVFGDFSISMSPAAASVWYLSLIGPWLVAAVTIAWCSVRHASFAKSHWITGVAIWNVSAIAINLYWAVESVPRSIGEVRGLLAGGVSTTAQHAALGVLAAIATGAILTWALMLLYRKAVPRRALLVTV